jgi:hypothetical protein
MSKGSKAEAENVSAVLSSVHRQQQSGLLQIESSQNGRGERGELYILAGQPIYARLGKLGGQEALDRLLAWGPISFSFLPDAPRPPANISHRPTARPSVSPVSGPLAAPPIPSFRRGYERPQGIETLIAQKNGITQATASVPLTHRQRMIYFLVDGQRTIADLARCSSRTIPEVESILRELQQMRLIVIFAPGQT